MSLTGDFSEVSYSGPAQITSEGRTAGLDGGQRAGRSEEKNGTDVNIGPACAWLDCEPRKTRFYAAPMVRRCWKHSRQKTGRPCVGRKGTVVSLPHWEQLVLVSERIGELPPPPPPPSARLALQPLHLLGSFLKPLSAKNICSPAVKTNSAPHSAHFKTRSWYSMSRSPLDPSQGGDGAQFALWAKWCGETCRPG